MPEQIAIVWTPAGAPCELTLPFPPSVNHYWRRGGGRGMKISQRGRTFRDQVSLHCFVNRHRAWPFAGRLAVTITYYRHDNQRYDVDNFAKAILDALQAASVFRDDYQVDRLTQIRGPVVEGSGYCSVQIEQLDAAAGVVECENGGRNPGENGPPAADPGCSH